MLLAASLPLCDLRPFLTDAPGRQGVRPDFLHFFGAGSWRPAKKSSRFGGTPEAKLFSARSAIRPHASPLGKCVSAPGADPFHWFQRQLSVQYPVVAHADVGVMAQDGAVRAQQPNLRRLADGWIELPVDVPVARRRETVALRDAGVLLAPIYAHATTRRRERHELSPAWTAAGHPCFFVEWVAEAGWDETGVPALELTRDYLWVGWGTDPASGPRARVVYIRHDGSDQARAEARALRTKLATLHAERECLWLVLRQIASGRLAPPGKPRLADRGGMGQDEPRASAESDRLQRYLSGAVTALTRFAAEVPMAFAQPEAQAVPAQAQLELEVRKDPASFSEALDAELEAQNVRGNVRRKAVAWARAETGEAAPEGTPVTRNIVTTDAVPSVDREMLGTPIVIPEPRHPPLLAERLAPIAADVVAKPGSFPVVNVIAPAAAQDRRGVSLDMAPLPPADVDVRAALGAVGREAAAPGDLVTFVVDLRVGADAADPGPGGARGNLNLSFADGEDTRTVEAAVTTTHFTRPSGESWKQSFVVRRAAVDNGQWSFTARAEGERSGYTLSVVFFAGTSIIGTLSMELPRRGAGAVAARGGTLAVPPSPERARLTLRITNDARTTRLSWLVPGSGQWTESPFDLGYNVDDCLTDLGAADHQALDQMRRYCVKFRLSLPPDLLEAIEGDPHPENGLVVLTSATLVPFELLPIDGGKTVLGLTRPVVRWPILLQNARGPGQSLPIKKVGCIRPRYQAKPLPSAADEETDLGKLFPGLSVVNDRAALDLLMNASDIDLLHFAGHAQSNPALLRMGDAEKGIDPQDFYGSGLTSRTPSPFFFVNGCEAGLGRTGILPARGNLLETLLACRFAGAVAPLIMVDSKAARDAAAAFYAAVAAGKTVGEAVQAIHAVAQQQPDKAGTFLSYVAYAPPDLRLTFAP